MSTNSRPASPGSTEHGPTCAADERVDARVRRTRERLGAALVALLQEKPFDTITVQDVLDRAGVGRSTFYVHYRDKDDLLLSDADRFFAGVAAHLERVDERSRRVAPVRELFAHVADMRRFHAALMHAGRLHDVLKLAEGHLALGIERRIATSEHARAMAAPRRAALARAYSAALVTLLSWWLDEQTPCTPGEADDLFHEMVWNGVGAERAGALAPLPTAARARAERSRARLLSRAAPPPKLARSARCQPAARAPLPAPPLRS